jgi:gas vesicle protein
MSNKRSFDEGTMFGGFILGLIVGAVVGLLKGPRLRVNKQEVVNQVNRLTQDELEKSIMYGKEAARRHRF